MIKWVLKERQQSPKVVAKVEDVLGHPEGVVHVLEECSYLGRGPKGEEALLGCRTEC